MTEFCSTRWSLYRDYCHENALASQRKPNMRQVAFMRCFLAATDRPCWYTWSRMMDKSKLIWQAERTVSDGI